VRIGGTAESLKLAMIADGTFSFCVVMFHPQDETSPHRKMKTRPMRKS